MNTFSFPRINELEHARGVSPAGRWRALVCLAAMVMVLAGMAGVTPARAQVVSQSGLSFNGTVNATPLGDTIIMSGNANWPASTFLDSFAFRGGIVAGGYLYLLPNEATEIVKVDLATGVMTGVPLPSLGGARDKFVGGAFDGTNIWFIPRDADAVVRLDTTDDTTTRFDAWPAGFTKGAGAFSGGIFDGRYVWMVPHNADRVVRVDTVDGSMTGFNAWPAGFTKGAAAFWGGVFDGTSMWMMPFNADRVVKIDTTTGVMTGYNSWPANYTLPTRAFAGGAFDGTSVWMAAYDSDRIISIDIATGTMTGYGTVNDATQWPSGYTKMPGNFNGALYDGDDVWFVPFESADLIKVDVATGVISNYLNYPAGINAAKLDKWAGAAMDGQKLYLIPGVEMTLITIESTPEPAVSAITRFGPTQQATNVDSVVYRVTFNKNVSGIDVSDFSLNTSGTATGSIAWVSAATGTEVTVTVDNVSGDGTLRLDLNASGTGIVDDYGYAIGNGFSSGETYLIDNTVPTITSAATDTTTYRASYSYAITVSGGAASSFSASGLPAGLSIDTATGVISGNATQTGSFTVNLTATDAAGNQDTATLALTIDKAPLTATGITAADKIYDGTTSATLDTSAAALVGVLSGDDVSLVTSSAAGAFASSAIGTGKPVTISGLTITGDDAVNYTFTPPGATADISAKPLTVTGAAALDRVYDGTAVAVIDISAAALMGVVPGDDVVLDASGVAGAFPDKLIGSAKPVTISGFAVTGADAGNYTLSQPAAAASIAPKMLSISGAVANSKTYDATAAADVDFGAATLVGVVPGDAVTLQTGGAAGVFADAAVGTGKPVTLSGVSIGGADAGNYVLSLPVLSADITARVLTVSGIVAADKTYDQTAAAVVDASGATLIGVVPGDQVQLNASALVGTFSSATAGDDKAVALAGLALTGADAANYTLATPSATASITARELTVSGVTAADKVYDGASDAQVNLSGATLQGVLPGDVVALWTTGATGAFESPAAGSGKTVTVSGLTLVGPDFANYTLAATTVTASVLPKGLTTIDVVARNKVYDGTTDASLDVSGASLLGVVSGDDVSLDASQVSASFADADVGTGKTVTILGLGLSGADAGNYSLTQPTASAAIARATATVSLGNTTQVYDATPKAVTVITVPADLPVDVTYDGSSLAPTAVGSYSVHATVTDPNYQGTAIGTLTIEVGTATVTISDTEQLFDGNPRPVSVETVPAGLAVEITYDGSQTAPSSIGEYSVVATIVDPGYTGSAAATLTIGPGSHVANLSARAWVGAGDQVVIPGFVIEGTGEKQVLVRGIGPELGSFGVAGVLAAPKLTLYSGETAVASNQGWSTAPNVAEIEAATGAVGAFELTPGSVDSVLLASLQPGFYTVLFAGADGGSGTGLVEVYDLDANGSASRLKNLSARALVGSGEDVLIPGCVVEGTGPRKLLIRAIGPGLGQFGVAGFLENPRLSVLNGNLEIAANDDWADAVNEADVVAATVSAGAFELDPSSKDAVVLITVDPGAYTVQVSGVDGATGVALVEIFEVE